MQGGPAEHVSNGNDNLSQLDLQRNHQFPGVFDLAEKFAQRVGPEGDEILAEVPKRDPDTAAKDGRKARVQQLPSDHQPVGFPTFLDTKIKLERLRSIEQVPLRMRRRPRAKCRCRKTVEQKLNLRLRFAAPRLVSQTNRALNWH